MKKLISLILFFTILLSACSTTTYVKRNPISANHEKKLNAIGRNHLSQVQLTNGELLEDIYIEIKSDSLYLNNSNSKKVRLVPISEVQYIVYNDRIIGVSYGILVGSLAGLVIGGVAGSGKDMGAVAGIGGAAVGLLFGSVSGIIFGSKQYYVFEN